MRKPFTFVQYGQYDALNTKTGADAIKDCDEAQKLVPNSPEVRDTGGFLFMKMSDYAKAVVEYNSALQIDPNHARSLYGRGLAKAKTGDKAAGDAEMASAVKIDPNVAQEFAKFGLK